MEKIVKQNLWSLTYDVKGNEKSISWRKREAKKVTYDAKGNKNNLTCDVKGNEKQIDQWGLTK